MRKFLSRFVPGLQAELLLTVAPHELALFHCDGRGKRQRELLFHWQNPQTESMPTLAVLTAQIQHALGEVARLRAEKLPHASQLAPVLRVVVSDWFARYFLVTPAQNSRRLADCEAAAYMRFQSLYGESPQSWQISAAWHASQTFLACALPVGLLAAISQAAREQQFKLLSMSPYLVANCNQLGSHLLRDGWLLLFEANRVKILVLEAGRICALHDSILTSNFWDTPQALLQLLEREAMRLASPLPSAVQLGGKVEKAWQAQKTAEIRCQHLPGFASSALHDSALQLLPGGVQ